MNKWIVAIALLSSVSACAGSPIVEQANARRDMLAACARINTVQDQATCNGRVAAYNAAYPGTAVVAGGGQNWAGMTAAGLRAMSGRY